MSAPEENLLFDPETHQYWVDGEEVLSVTQILTLCGLIDGAWFTYESSQRGTAVHLATQYLDKDDLDWDSVSPGIVGHVESYLRFKEESGFSVEKIECHLFNPTYRFAGTPDRIGIMSGEKALVDIKTGQKADWHPLQTAGYALLLENRSRRYSLYLSKKGTYSLIEHRNHQDHSVFLAALTVAHWKKTRTRTAPPPEAAHKSPSGNRRRVVEKKIRLDRQPGKKVPSNERSSIDYCEDIESWY